MRIEHPEKKGEFIDFKGEGWKYKHLRLWEEASSAGQTAAVISERIEGWHLLDETGAEIPFEPGDKALDEIPPKTASWVVGKSFIQAYRQAGAPAPNA